MSWRFMLPLQLCAPFFRSSVRLLAILTNPKLIAGTSRRPFVFYTLTFSVPTHCVAPYRVLMHVRTMECSVIGDGLMQPSVWLMCPLFTAESFCWNKLKVPSTLRRVREIRPLLSKRKFKFVLRNLFFSVLEEVGWSEIRFADVRPNFRVWKNNVKPWHEYLSVLLRYLRNVKNEYKYSDWTWWSLKYH